MSFKQKLLQTWTTVIRLYTTGQRDGWRQTLLHAFTCLFISLTLSSLLFLILHMYVDLTTSGGIAGSSGLLMSVILFFSKGFRCFVLLLLISCVMQQGRNILLTTGAGLSLFLSIRNMYGNLLGVSRSVVCNLEKKKEQLDFSPIGNYIEMMKWVEEKLRMFSDLGVMSFKAQMQIHSHLESEELRNKLEEAKAELKLKAERVQAALDLLTSVWKTVAPGLGIILLVVLAALFLKKFTREKRFQNTYITSRFVAYDERQKAAGKPHVLPLSEEEAGRYIFIPSARPRLREGGPVAQYFIPVGTYVLCWFLFIGLDLLLHWIISVINEKLMGLKPFHVPLRMSVHETRRVLLFDVGEEKMLGDFSFSVSVFESECAPRPTLLISRSVVPLSVVIVVLLILGLLTAKLLQVKLLVSELFFTENAGNRVEHLHKKILRRRRREALDGARFQSPKKDVKFWFPILDYCCGTDHHLRQQSAAQYRA